MLGALIDSLDDPAVAARLVAEIDLPEVAARLQATAAKTGRAPAEVMASTVRRFLDAASDDHWVQLIGTMSRAEDPALAALRAILAKAAPTGAA